MVSMAGQHFMTQMSNWMTDTSLDVYFQALLLDDTFLYFFKTLWCD